MFCWPRHRRPRTRRPVPRMSAEALRPETAQPATLSAHRALRRRVLMAGASIPFWLRSRKSIAQPGRYPDRPIRLVTPSPAGGTGDLLLRLVGPPLGDVLGQPIIVENKPGAGGRIVTHMHVGDRIGVDLADHMIAALNDTVPPMCSRAHGSALPTAAIARTPNPCGGADPTASSSRRAAETRRAARSPGSHTSRWLVHWRFRRAGTESDPHAACG